jgi:hypothetical protein
MIFVQGKLAKSKIIFFNVTASHGWHLPKSNLRAEKLGIDLIRDKPW